MTMNPVAVSAAAQSTHPAYARVAEHRAIHTLTAELHRRLITD